MSDDIQSAIILDWYDGIIQGIVQFKNRKEYFYCSLVCIEKLQKMNIYLLIEINQDDFDHLLKILEPQKLDLPSWVIEVLSKAQEKRLKEWIETIYSKCSLVTLVKAINIDEAFTAEKIIRKDLISLDAISLDISQLANMLDEEKSQWLNYFTPKP